MDRLRRTRQKFSDWWEDWNRGRFLSRFERGLTILLWLLAIVAVTFVYAHHVWLVDQPPLFAKAAAWGTVTYELAIGYVGAFIFYILNVRLPQRRDRRNVYKHLAPLLGRVVGEACNLIQHLNAAAGVDVLRINTLDNVEDTCTRVDLGQLADFYTADDSGKARRGNVLDYMIYDMDRARDVNRELRRDSSYLSTDVISLLVDIDEQGYFRTFDLMASTGTLHRPGNFSVMGRPIFDYLQLADHIDNYRHRFLPLASHRRPELVSGSVRRSTATPLRRHMDHAGP